jgi:hypothetical protein
MNHSAPMGRSTLGSDRRIDDTFPMPPHQVLDLRDEPRLLALDRVEYDPGGVRDLLFALRLKPAVGATVDASRGNVFDLAVYRATGDRHLAALFGTAA